MTQQSARVPISDRVPPTVLVLGGIVSVQVGAAFAKTLFDHTGSTSMAWLRLATSALVFWLLFRPRLGGHRRSDWLVALAFGLNLCLTNWVFYAAIARIPIGVAVTIEFLGPLALAVVGSRRLVDLVWVVLAGSGVALLGLSPTRLDPLGVACALVAAAGWAGYILLSAQTGRRWSGLSGLVVASGVGAVVLAGPAIHTSGTVLLEPRVLLIGAVVGVLSAVVPYSLELVALRRIAPRVFGILMSLEPAVAAVAAMIVLREFLAPTQWVAVGCVVAASVGATRTARTAPLAETLRG